jgi:glycosyltransferase involved in cell wall biosynthesis
MILLYHKIHPEAKTIWWVTPNAFYLQMLDLQNKKVVYLDDYDGSDPDQCVITFDGVYDNLWKYAVPILQHFGYPFELFIVGGSIGQGNEFDTIEPYAPFADKETLSKMVAAGGRLQWHTWSHPVLVGDHSEGTYQRELIVPDDLRSLDPNGFKWFGFPHGQRDEALKEQSRKYFQGALACDDGAPSDIYDLQRTIVYEKTRFSESTVSLVIPCYNYGHLLAEAIESALYQICPADEIIVIDDASSDNSVEVAKRYESRVRVVVNPKNLGVVGNFTKAVQMTSGDYVCFLGADNRFRSDYIEKTKAVLDANPDVAIAYTNFVLFDKRAAVTATMMGAKPHPKIPEFFLMDFPANPQKDIREQNYIHGSSMYRRKAYDDAGGYTDHSLFARMLDKGWKARLVNEYILEYRQHSKDQINLLKALEIENVHLRAQPQILMRQIAEQTQMIQLLSAQEQVLNEIIQSKAWRLVLILRKIRLWLLPPNSLLERFVRFLYRIFL